MLLQVILEGLGLGALLALVCAVGIRKGAVGMVHLYSPAVQQRCVKLGLSTDADCYFVSRVDICFSLCLLYFFFISKMQRYIDGIVDCYWHSPYSDFCLHSIRGKLDFSYFSICGTWYAK